MNEVLTKYAGSEIRVFAIWERVMRSDQEPPSTETLGRVTVPGATQFWDPERTV